MCEGGGSMESLVGSDRRRMRRMLFLDSLVEEVLVVVS